MGITKKNKLSSIETCYAFKSKLWKYDGPAGWCFVTIPKSVAKKIRASFHTSEGGWGRLLK